MKSFTFVTLSYNHEKEIEEHLESIKQIVEKFAHDIKVSYILCDDCSRDNTVALVTDWIKKNPIFQEVTINRNTENIGTVKNFINAISMVKTEDFKLLAGDDKYGAFNIFKLFDNLKQDILITPVTPFGNVNSSRRKDMEELYRTLMYMHSLGKSSNLLQVFNFIPAPGAFYKLSLVKDVTLIDYLRQFRYIEDYPLFYFLLNIKKIDLVVDNHSYVYYRISSGISTNVTSKLHKEYLKDLEKVRKVIGTKAYILPKYINPYRYYLKYIKIRAAQQKESLPIYFLPEKENS